MNEFALFLGMIALWVVLNRWVLPRFGISTCMSGGCAADYRRCCGPGSGTHLNKDDVEPKRDQP